MADCVGERCFPSDGIERKDSPAGFAPEQQGMKHSRRADELLLCYFLFANSSRAQSE